MRYFYFLILTLLFNNCSLSETEDFTNCHDPEHEEFVYPNIILENFKEVYDTSDISISWFESEYCGITEYNINLNNRNFENADYSKDWFQEDSIELNNLDDGIWDLQIFVFYEIMEYNDVIDIDTFNFEFEIDAIPSNNIRLSPMNLNYNQDNEFILIDLIVEELLVSELNNEGIENGISGFGIELIIPNNLELIEVLNINENFTSLNDLEESISINSLWQIIPYDLTNNLLMFSLLNNLNDQNTFIDETILLAKLKFKINQLDLTTTELSIQFLNQNSKYYWYDNENLTSFHSTTFSGYHGTNINIIR
jgi:hypothetical protein